MKPLRRFVMVPRRALDIPLTKYDMYDKKGDCKLPKITPKKYLNRSRYDPATEDKKPRRNTERVAINKDTE